MGAGGNADKRGTRERQARDKRETRERSIFPLKLRKQLTCEVSNQSALMFEDRSRGSPRPFEAVGGLLLWMSLSGGCKSHVEAESKKREREKRKLKEKRNLPRTQRGEHHFCSLAALALPTLS